ncbi:MAG: methyltransferase FkbM [Flavisolibacter sp.]|jgi:FkbM family methyltransferase|nr:methyltransferase FkbM [Flavisolibacter sp.]
MNYKLFIGRSFATIDVVLKKSNLKIINNKYPWGRDFVFDLKRLFDGDINIIVDAGANIGSVASDFSYYFPQAKILAFEPIISTFEKLKRKCSIKKNILPVHSALGESNYEIEIPLNTEDTINSILSAPQEHQFSGYETIRVQSLASYAENHSIEKIDILKIDVEGYEFKVLEGAQHFIINSIKAIVLEVGYERSSNKVHFSDVEIYMEKYGFQCCGIYDLSKSRDKKRLYYSNSLYIRKSLL